MLCDPPRDLARGEQPPSAGRGLPALAEHPARLRPSGRPSFAAGRPAPCPWSSSGLRILAAVHDPGEPVRASTVQQLKPRNIPARHVIDVLDPVRVPCSTIGLTRSRPGSRSRSPVFPSQIRAELEVWIERDATGGTPHAVPPQHDHLDQLLQHPPPFLADILRGRYATLRQVTPGRTHILDRCAARLFPRRGRQHAPHHVAPGP